MVTTAKDRTITILVHVLVWVFLVYVLLMYPPLSSAQSHLPPAFWVKQCAHIAIIITLFYFNASILVPRLLEKNKVAVFIAVIGLLSLFCSFILQRIDVWLNLGPQLCRIFGRKMWNNPYIDHFGLITTLLVLGISTSVTMVQRWSTDAGMRREFESQRTIAELAFLKAQIHPHFFFNTLNSIYALTYINVETSRQVLHKLSRMMRYLLYETQQDTTLLSKELAFLTDYIEIMKLRLNSHTTVHFTRPLNVSEAPIAPMLLLPFVENAFKHGVDDLQPGTITIAIEQIDQQLELEVKNTLIDPTINSSAHQLEGKGIGMINTRRRLDLLYTNRYALTAERNEQLKEYCLHLTLTLT